MNKTGLITLFSFLFCLLSISSYAQRSEISKKQFSDAHKSANENLRKFSYRIISEDKTYQKSKRNLVSLSKKSYEFVPPDREHFISETKLSGQSKIVIVEEITAGNKYIKKADGTWTVELITSFQPAVREDPYWSIGNNNKYYLTETVKLNGKPARLYQRITKLGVFMVENQKPINENILKESFWLNSEGLLLKVEIKINMYETLNPKLTIEHSVIIYQYDPNIKIEAPKIIKETR